MPAYRFEALDATGRSSSGLIDADNAKAARAQLRAQKLVPIEVQAVGSASAEAGSGVALRMRGRVFSATALAIWPDVHCHTGLRGGACARVTTPSSFGRSW